MPRWSRPPVLRRVEPFVAAVLARCALLLGAVPAAARWLPRLRGAPRAGRRGTGPAVVPS
ncbi:hypothetical protein [Kineococcus sp. SYSU DK005]|uniref:hypothetical protein n=1 Tax=Kineococcus sp. SYSU DK005 TaxID=3383126 RepID=UPI003D7DE6F7